MAKTNYNEIKISAARTALFNNIENVIEEVNIHDVAKLSSGENLPIHKMVDGKYPVFGGGGATNLTHNIFNVDFETLAIGRVGARCGCVFKVPKRSWVTDNALYAIAFDKRFNLDFLIHYLSYVDLNQYANRAAQPVISLKRISSINFPLIEISKQQEFVKIIEQVANGKTNFGNDYSKLNNALKSVDSIKQLQNELSHQLTQIENLNQAILQEAVQGKLLSEPGFIGLKDKQDLEEIENHSNHINQKNHSSDTGHELLKRIKAEKQKSGKKEKPLPPIKQEEIPFEIPGHWVWCRLGEIALHSEAGKSFKCEEIPIVSNEWGVIKVSAVSWDNFLESQNKLYSKTEPLDIKAKIEVGDFLISRANTSELVGKSVVVKSISRNLLLSDKTIRFKFSKSASTDYVNKCNNSIYARKYYSVMGTGTSPSMKNITREHMTNLLIPLPPLSEQKLIVAEIEKQLSKTKQLKEHIIANQQATEQLLKALLHGAFLPTEAAAQAGEVEEK